MSDIFSAIDLPNAQDLQTAQAAQADPATRASQALNANPRLVNDPVGAKAILSQPTADGHTTGQVAKFASTYGNVHEGVKAAATGDNPHAGNFFSDLWNGVASAWDGARHIVAGTADSLYNFARNADTQQGLDTTNYGILGGTVKGDQPLINSATDLAKGVGRAAKRAVQTTTELGSLGQVNSNFQADGNIGANLSDAAHTIANAANNTLNPFTTYRNMAHTIAFTESLAKRRGWGVAMETMLPYLATAMVTHTALVGNGLAAKEVSAITGEAENAGVALTPEELAMQREAQGVIQTTPTEGVAPEGHVFEPRTGEPPPETVNEPAGRSGVFKGTSKIVGTLTKPLGAVTRVAHVLGKPTQDVTMNAMYSLLHGTMSQDKELGALWNLTANGVPVDENNKPMGSVGSNIAGYLGLPKGTLADVIAAPVNIYANYLGADALGAAGRVVGMTRTADSVGGIVGKFFSGMRIHAPEDVYRTASQYRRVNRAFEWIANHSAGQINETFKGMFIGEAGKKVLGLLGDAKTPEEVMKIWADMSQGINYVHNAAPSMSLYQVTKASFKYGDRMFSVGNSLAQNADQLHAEAADIQKATGLKVWPPDSANFAVGEGEVASRMRARTVLANKLAETFSKYEAGTQLALSNAGRKLFTNRESYFNEATQKLENFTMHAGSTQLPVAIGDQLRALGEDPATIAMVQDQLLHASQDEINNFIKNIYFDTTMKLFYANAKYSVLDQVKVAVEKDLRDQLESMMGPDGAGTKGVMVNGIEGQRLSRVSDGTENGAKNAGIGETHLGELHFPRTRDLKNWAKFTSRIADEFSHAQDGMLGVDNHLSPEALDRKASFANANLGGIAGSLDAKVGTFTSTGDLGHLSSDAYDAKLNELKTEISNAYAQVAKGDTIGHNKAFVEMALRIRQNTDTVNRLVSLADEWNLRSADIVTGSDTYNRILSELNSRLPENTISDIRLLSSPDLARLRGELDALKDTRAELNARLQKNAIGLKEIEAHVEGRNPGMTEAQRTRLAQRIQSLRESNPRYRTKWNYFMDGVNYYTSKIFTPMALTSGGWAIRVGNSEMLLNTFREGGMNMFQSKLLTSYLKHETGRTVFTSRMNGMLERYGKDELFRGSMNDMLKRTDISYGVKLMAATVRSAGGLILAMRDVAGGTIHGIEGNLINWTPRTERMMQRVVGALQDYAPGGLPMGVHSSGGIMADDALQKHLLFGEDENGKSVASTVNHNRTFASANAGENSYYRGLRSSLTRIHDDKILAPAMQRLNELLPTLPKVLDTQEVTRLEDELTQTSLQTINSLSEGELSRFARHYEKGNYALSDNEVLNKLSAEEKQRVLAMSPSEQQTFFAHYDWARTVAYHDLHTVLGKTGNDEFVIHGSLVNQAATGEVKSMFDLRKEIDALPRGSEPQNIVAEGVHYDDAVSSVRKVARFLANVPQEVSDKMFNSFLGPMVNAYVRDPVYLTMYDSEMEKLQAFVDKNIIPEDAQKVLAHTNASVRMSRFVHNPQDRTLFESNMRAFAPFYFAQNQAWRRVFRMASEDPGAFEKYLRMSLAVTNWVSPRSNNSASPVPIPGTQFMGAMAGLGSGLAPNQLGSLGFSLAGSVGSISSVIPTGSEAGLGVLENIVRPSWGPAVSVALKEIQHYLGLDNNEYANKFVRAVLGPLGANSSTLEELAPSSILRNTYNLAEGATNQVNASFNTAMIYAFNNAVDNLSKKLYDQAYKNGIKQGLSSTVASQYARAMAERELPKQLNMNNNQKFVQEFLNQVHAAATVMYAVKTALGFVSPVALSLQETFSKYPQFNKILNEKNPDGSLKYTFVEAMTVFADKYPNHLSDLVAHTQPIGSLYPETQSALNVIEKYPYAVNTYPNAAAYLTNYNGPFSPQAFQDELSHHLRARYGAFSGGNEGLGAYADAIFYAIGNDYYYNTLKQIYPESQGNVGYENYKALTDAAKQYGHLQNTAWYAQFSTGKNGYIIKAQAVQQMEQMLNDKNVPPAAYGGAKNKSDYETVMKAYQETVAAYDSAGSKSEKYQIESDWYNKMTTLSADTTLVSPALSYFMTSVLRGLPTATK